MMLNHVSGVFKSIRDIKFRKKFFLICVIISMIPALILGFFAYSQINELLTERERANMRSRISQESSSVAQRLKTYETVGEYITWNSELRKTLSSVYATNSAMYETYTQNIEPFLDSVQYLSPGLEDIILYTNASIYPRTGVLEPLENVADKPWYSESLRRTASARFFWDNGKLLMTDTFPELSNGISAFACLTISHKALFADLTALFDSHYGVLITEADGSPIFSYTTADFPACDINDPLSFSTSKAYITETVHGAMDWVFYLYRPTRYIVAATGTILYTVLIVLLCCLAFILICSYWFSSALVRPLETLADKLHRVGKGEYVEMQSSPSQDEVCAFLKGSRNRRLQPQWRFLRRVSAAWAARRAGEHFSHGRSFHHRLQRVQLIQVLTVNDKENLVDVGQKGGLSCGLEGGQSLAGTGGMPNITAACHTAVLLIVVGNLNAVQDTFCSGDLIWTHDHQHVL